MKALDLVEDGFMTVKEACRWLKLSRSKLYQLMENGELPYSMLAPGKRGIPKKALKLYAARRMRGRLLGEEIDKQEGQTNDVA